ncbi:hypothetical protein AMEX_G10267 [Astyanax mexicanus]|uniref:Uncharacterized protein n=1 Tax=Astyanax mexicanus TaxID=7994 RepID=A0A8T2LUW3_ASTMX|nr:hypothetical protein AMEX_G10267 [Astyanax mexicanus]
MRDWVSHRKKKKRENLPLSIQTVLPKPLQALVSPDAAEKSRHHVSSVHGIYITEGITAHSGQRSGR